MQTHTHTHIHCSDEPLFIIVQETKRFNNHENKYTIHKSIHTRNIVIMKICLVVKMPKHTFCASLPVFILSFSFTAPNFLERMAFLQVHRICPLVPRPQKKCCNPKHKACLVYLAKSVSHCKQNEPTLLGCYRAVCLALHDSAIAVFSTYLVCTSSNQE